MGTSKHVAVRLSEMSERIQDGLNVCSSSKKRTELIRALSSISTTCASELDYLKQHQKRKFVQVRKHLTAVNNVVSGLTEGLTAKELSLSDFRGHVNSLVTKFFPRLCESLSSELEAQTASEEAQVELTEQQQAVKSEIAESGDLRDALAVIKKLLKERAQQTAPVAPKNHPAAQTQDEAQDGVSAELTKLSNARAALPIRLKSEFQVVRMPIIPIFSNYALNSTDNFKRLGINFISVEGYAVLLDQLLVLVSSRKAESHGMKSSEYAQSVLSLLNERGTIDYAFVTDEYQVNPRNTDIHMFWALPMSKMNALLRIAQRGRTASTVKWGLPF